MMPADHWAALFAEMREINFKRGEVIFRRDDPGDGLYFVEDGRVRISVVGADGRELSFTVIEQGMIFGEIAALDDNPRTADASAMTAVTTRFISKDKLNALIDSQPGLGRAIITFLCERIRAADIQLESIALMTLERRIAAFLLVLAGNQEGPEVDISFELSQSEFAKLLGASRPKVNAVLKKFAEDETVQALENKLRCDLSALRMIAES